MAETSPPPPAKAQRGVVLTNTAIYCLKVLAGNGWLNPRTIARRRWPSSKQPTRKEQAIRQYCDALVRQGYLQTTNDYYHATDIGRRIADGANQQQRPPVMRVAGNG